MTTDANEDTLDEADRTTEAAVRRLASELGAHYESTVGIRTYTAEPAPSKSRRKYRALVAAAAMLVITLTVATLAYRSGTIVDPTTGQTEEPNPSLVPRFGTMPHWTRGEPGTIGSGIDPALVPEYIGVVDGNSRSDKVVGYVKSSTLLFQGGQPSPLSEQRPGTAMTRLYDTSLNVIGYYLPETGPLTLEEAEPYLANPDYYVDPNS